jgi:Acyl-CoA thioesterase C-terminal domain/Acyl-CoA thioesterase N-terminal domain
VSSGSQAPVGEGGSEGAVDESIFLAEGESFAPTEHARGPWDPRALHGGAPAALITSAFESVEPGVELQIARLGFELLRPVPFAPLEISTSIVRAGRRVQELAAEMRSGEELICRASALRVQAVPTELPDDLSTERLTAVAAGPMPGPEHGTAVRFALDDLDRASFAASAMEMRWIDDPWAPGPGRVWMRLRHPLLPRQELTPLARLAATADFANGVSAVLPFDRFLFINADLTIHLQRQPRGEWIGLDARTLLHEGGTGLSDSVLHDEHGPVGRSFQTLVVQPR